MGKVTALLASSLPPGLSPTSHPGITHLTKLATPPIPGSHLWVHQPTSSLPPFRKHFPRVWTRDTKTRWRRMSRRKLIFSEIQMSTKWYLFNLYFAICFILCFLYTCNSTDVYVVCRMQIFTSNILQYLHHYVCLCFNGRKCHNYQYSKPPLHHLVALENLLTNQLWLHCR